MNQNFLNLKEKTLFDVSGIGSALLDFTVKASDKFLTDLNLKKGEMHLIDESRSREIFTLIKDLSAKITPGGSSANTLAGVSNLSGKSIFLGKVGRDQYGKKYIAKTKETGVQTKISTHHKTTGHAITFITPDSERTFATHLGAALEFHKKDISEEDISNSKILHLEGYLFESPQLNEACLEAIDIAKKNKVLVSVDLADPALINRIYNIFDKVVKDHVDIVFVNEEEAKAFTKEEKKQALDKISQMCQVAIVKLGSKGSLIKSQKELAEIPVYKTEVINTNGAGDMYAAGFLYGLSRGYSLSKAGHIGSYASSLVVAQEGARVQKKIDYQKILL